MNTTNISSATAYFFIYGLYFIYTSYSENSQYTRASRRLMISKMSLSHISLNQNIEANIAQMKNEPEWKEGNWTDWRWSRLEQPRADKNEWYCCKKYLSARTEIECQCWHDWQLTIPFIQGLDVSWDVTVTKLGIINKKTFHINAPVLKMFFCMEISIRYSFTCNTLFVYSTPTIIYIYIYITVHQSWPIAECIIYWKYVWKFLDV